MVKIWSYDEGLCYFIGAGHSGAITKITISPDQRTIVSVGAEGKWRNIFKKILNIIIYFIGAIFLWKMPEEVVSAKAENELPTITKDKPELMQSSIEKSKGPKNDEKSKNGKSVISKNSKTAQSKK